MPEWRRLTFSIAPHAQDELIVRLHELGSLGVETVGAHLSAYFQSGLDETALLRDVERELGAGASMRLVASEPMKDGFWHERWMESLEPFAIGKGFLVVPGPATPPDTRGRVPLHLTPGRAFGTGEHGTTRMCLAMMEDALHAGDSLLDAGTGSGILAIAARKLGAGLVLGIDSDETAVAVAARNLQLNDARGVLLAACTLDALRWKPFDVLVANINGTTLVRLMEALCGMTRRDAILSGILLEEEREVVGAATCAGMTVARRMTEADWLAVTLRRPPRA